MKISILLALGLRLHQVTSLTSHPSSNPTALPSNTPSSSPSYQSSQPSHLPSSSPSGVPSHTPPLAPSSSPSVAPSERPSDSPSSRPSTSPSTAPSMSPSSNPSSGPSDAPSSSPSSSPSTAPSERPSDSPSSAPSDAPSSSPSSTPSMLPSSNPSNQPSSSPSTHPSKQLSTSPSVSPSLQPSPNPSSSPTTSPTLIFPVEVNRMQLTTLRFPAASNRTTLTNSERKYFEQVTENLMIKINNAGLLNISNEVVFVVNMLAPVVEISRIVATTLDLSPPDDRSLRRSRKLAYIPTETSLDVYYNQKLASLSSTDIDLIKLSSHISYTLSVSTEDTLIRGYVGALQSGLKVLSIDHFYNPDPDSSTILVTLPPTMSPTSSPIDKGGNENNGLLVAVVVLSSILGAVLLVCVLGLGLFLLDDYYNIEYEDDSDVSVAATDSTLDANKDVNNSKLTWARKAIIFLSDAMQFRNKGEPSLSIVIPITHPPTSEINIGVTLGDEKIELKVKEAASSNDTAAGVMTSIMITSDVESGKHSSDTEDATIKTKVSAPPTIPVIATLTSPPPPPPPPTTLSTLGSRAAEIIKLSDRKVELNDSFTSSIVGGRIRMFGFLGGDKHNVKEIDDVSSRIFNQSNDNDEYEDDDDESYITNSTFKTLEKFYAYIPKDFTALQLYVDAITYINEELTNSSKTIAIKNLMARLVLNVKDKELTPKIAASCIHFIANYLHLPSDGDSTDEIDRLLIISGRVSTANLKEVFGGYGWIENVKVNSFGGEGGIVMFEGKNAVLRAVEGYKGVWEVRKVKKDEDANEEEDEDEEDSKVKRSSEAKLFAAHNEPSSDDELMRYSSSSVNEDESNVYQRGKEQQQQQQQKRRLAEPDDDNITEILAELKQRRRVLDENDGEQSVGSGSGRSGKGSV